MPDDYQPKPRRLWVAALIFCVVVIADSCFRWATYQYGTFDLAFYVHTFWLALQGKSHSTILDVSLMGNHAEPICYVLLPLFWIWKHPSFFVVIQTLLLATMPFTAYRIARRMEFERRGALWLAFATLLAPATGFMALHEFHPETLAAPLILLLLEARLAARPGTYWIWFLLAVACKENVALMLAWLCVVNYLLDRERPREWQMTFNVVPGAVALGWVLLYGLWLGPALNGGKVDYNELYGHVGGIGGVIRSPGASISAAWNAVMNGNLVWGLLIPFLFLPLLRVRWMVVAAPIFAQHLLSSRSSEWSIQWHYAAPLLPVLWYGAAEACSRLFWRDVMAGWIAAACVICQFWLGPIYSVFQTIKTAGTAHEAAKIRTELLDAIPDEASVVAGLPYLSHVAMREQVHSLHHILKGLKTLSRATYVPPPPTDAVFVDATDAATFNRFAGYFHPTMLTVDGRTIPESDQLLESFLKTAKWRALARNEVTLFLRDPSAGGSITAEGEGKPLDDYHRLLSVSTAKPLFEQDATQIVFCYEIQPNRPMVPWVTLYLKGEDGRQFAITKGPIGLGKPSGIPFAEAWQIRPSVAIPRGKYHVFLDFHDPHQSLLPNRFEKPRPSSLGVLELR